MTVRRSAGRSARIWSTRPCPMTTKGLSARFAPASRSCRSRRRTRERLTRYSASPLRNRRRPTSISVKSIGNRREELSRWSTASAIERAFRDSLPPKMSSSFLFARSTRALFSPSAQRIASAKFDLPLPFGPMIAVIPGANSRWVLCTKLLNPVTSRLFSTAFGAPTPPSMSFSASPARSSLMRGSQDREGSRRPPPPPRASIARSPARPGRRPRPG